jgi:hypothetical protein
VLQRRAFRFFVSQLVSLEFFSAFLFGSFFANPSQRRK